MGAYDYFEVTDDILAEQQLAGRWKRLEQQAMRQERLPFTVKTVRSDEELWKAVRIRQAAYARHVPEFAEKLAAPEPYDIEEGSVVLLAESKLDGSPLGTLRLQSNQYRKLGVEQSVQLPEWLRDCSMVEGTRLGISEGRIGRVVKAALIKAFYLYCLEWDIDWIVITARKPLDRQYEAFLYQDVYPGGEFIPMRHIGNIPHRVMAFEVKSGETRWQEAKHPLFEFMCRTHHPDIDVNGHNSYLFAQNRMREPDFSNRIGTRQ
jgi:hypothetical protein